MDIKNQNCDNRVVNKEADGKVSPELAAKVKGLFDALGPNASSSEREELDRLLLTQAILAMNYSYCPYSDFPVGAALLSKTGQLFLGCNVENASYGGTICAERTAVVKAVSEGFREFDTVAVVCQKNKDAWPCGFCRQFLSEFGADLRIIVEGSSGTVEVMSMSDLLPRMFGPAALG